MIRIRRSKTNAHGSHNTTNITPIHACILNTLSLYFIHDRTYPATMLHLCACTRGTTKVQNCHTWLYFSITFISIFSDQVMHLQLLCLCRPFSANLVYLLYIPLNSQILSQLNSQLILKRGGTYHPKVSEQ